MCPERSSRTLASKLLGRSLLVAAFAPAAIALTACSRTSPGAGCETAACQAVQQSSRTVMQVVDRDAGHGLSLLAATSDTGMDMAAWTGLADGSNTTWELLLDSWPATEPGMYPRLTTVAAAGADNTRLLRSAEGNLLLLAGEPADFEQSHLVLYAGPATALQRVRIDGLGNTGVRFDGVLDDKGMLHIAWLETGNGQLRYATWKEDFIEEPHVLDSGFDETQGGPGGDLDLTVSIGVSPSGTRGIAYYDATNGQLRIAAAATDGTWKIIVPGIVHTGIQLDVAADGTVQLPSRMVMRYDHLQLYENGSPVDDTRMALVAPDQLRIENADAGASYTLDYIEPYSDDYGRASAIALADDGTFHVATVNTSAGTLEYLVNAAPFVERNWLRETIDADGLPGGKIRLLLAPAFDASGVQRGVRPVVAYQRTTVADLMLAFRADGDWSANRLTLSSAGLAGFDAALARRGDRLLIGHRRFDPATLLSELEILEVPLP